MPGMAVQPAAGLLGGVLEEDGTDDEDGPQVTPPPTIPSLSTCLCNALQCLADILPATQRAKSNVTARTVRRLVAAPLQHPRPHVCRSGCHVHHDRRRPAPVFFHEQGHPQERQCRPQGQGPPRRCAQPHAARDASPHARAADAQRIMGQANLEFAMGNFDHSRELCLRVVQVSLTCVNQRFRVSGMARVLATLGLTNVAPSL